MPIEYRYDSALNAVVTTVTGRLEESEVLAHHRKLYDDDNVPSGFIEIVDLSSADDFAIEASGVVKIASLVPDLRARKDYRSTAFFAPTDLSFGIAQMFQRMLENLGMGVEVHRDWDAMAAVVTKRLREKRT